MAEVNNGAKGGTSSQVPATARDVTPVAKLSPHERGIATRRRMAEAAYRLFAEQGYAATTMEAIAQTAGVAVQTVYFTFHTKADVLIEALKIAGGAAGEASQVGAREWFRDVVQASDGSRRLAIMCEHGIDIYRRLAPMLRAVSAAASVDAEVNKAWGGLVEARRSGMRQVMRTMADRGELRAGVDEQLATDLLFGLHRPELFLAFTVECGWSPESFKAWIYATLCQQLLPAEVAAAALASGSAATKGLTFETALRGLPIG
jgi:TetR/AcrR family transcriptional regulator of autoinduction and epiphytic fitness